MCGARAKPHIFCRRVDFNLHSHVSRISIINNNERVIYRCAFAYIILWASQCEVSKFQHISNWNSCNYNILRKLADLQWRNQINVIRWCVNHAADNWSGDKWNASMDLYGSHIAHCLASRANIWSDLTSASIDYTFRIKWIAIENAAHDWPCVLWARA